MTDEHDNISTVSPLQRTVNESCVDRYGEVSRTGDPEAVRD
jgi:hypothetical protein